ncbi:cytochrome P450 [Aspergillus karnatakaensis]|uniref:cytochrome P450 n=1 Tax=Aspergillus karnatakaensis TaxID=1810916 RepID=UPI003CCDECC5
MASELTPLASLPGLVTTFFIVNVLVLITWQVIVYPYFYSPLRLLPRPKNRFPTITHLLNPTTNSLSSIYHAWASSTPNDGLITYRSFFNQDRLIVTSAKGIADVLLNNTYAYTKQPNERDVIRRFLGEGLTISEGEVHRIQRKIIGSVYTKSVVRGFYDIFWQKGIELVRCLECDLGNEGETVVEITQWASQITMDIIGLAALGRDFGTLSGTGDQLSKELFSTYQEIFTWTPEKELFMAFNRVLPRGFVQWLPWGVNHRIDVTSVVLRGICRRLVREKVEEFYRTDGAGEDLVARMLRTGRWEAEGLVEQLLTIIAAGHETSASAFTWTCYLLAQHPSAQERLRRELIQGLDPLHADTPSSEILSSTLESLPYLNAICNESLRFIPPVPLIRRVATVPTIIQNQAVPPGTQILLCPHAINRSPELWGPDADRFNPDRWINPETGKANNDGGMVSNYANMTFSHGPRSCIGQGFAKAELRTLIAVFVSNFRFSLAQPGEEVVPVGIVSVRPKDGLHLKVEKVTSG